MAAPLALFAIGAGASALGSAMSSKSQAGANEKVYDYTTRLLNPTMAGRQTMGQLVNENLQATGKFPNLTPTSPMSQATEQLALLAQNPNLISQFILSQNPADVYSGLQQDSAGRLQADMRDILNATSSQYGGSYGLRRGGSSELDEAAMRLGSDQALRLRSNIAGLYPQLQSGFGNLLSYIPSIIGSAGGLGTQRDIASLGASSQFLNNIFPPSQYASPSGAGSFLGEAGGATMAWPLYKQMIS